VLQVGHLERFNAAVQAIEGIVSGRASSSATRLAPFKQRGTDVSVVLDLMIHDIDLIQSIVRSPIARSMRSARPVFSDDLDIANARLRFARLRRQRHREPRQPEDRAQAARCSRTTPTCRSTCSRRS
jgi:predicted dehydrogenase